jgi:para-aminobenzoate synthetase component 1
MFEKEIKMEYSVNDFLASFGNRDGFYLLDGGECIRDTGRFSYIGIRPGFSVYQIGERSFLKKNGSVKRIKGNLLNFISDFTKKNRREEGCFPFSGGFIGYLTYDFGWLLDKFRPASFKTKILGLPLAKFNYYDELFVIDRKDKKLFFVSERKNGDEKSYLSAMMKDRHKQDTVKFSPLRSTLSKIRYVDAVERTKSYIARGDIYQANISQRFACNFSGNPVDFYCKLRSISPAPFGAFLRDSDTAILCNSPERFLYKRGEYVETRPIKGTRKRARDRKHDDGLIKELRVSEKDKAEHIMIVDLERNDLGRVCEMGSIHVKNLMDIESYATVHHMVSTVAGTLKSGKDIVDCIYGCFPGGSITGAPKLRSMEIIEELEPVKRGIYCGSIGYIDNSGNADLNIAIRTGIVTNNRFYFYVGGGIVTDSDPENEHEETIIKARSFLAAMGIAEVSY